MDTIQLVCFLICLGCVSFAKCMNVIIIKDFALATTIKNNSSPRIFEVKA